VPYRAPGVRFRNPEGGAPGAEKSYRIRDQAPARGGRSRARRARRSGPNRVTERRRTRNASPILTHVPGIRLSREAHAREQPRGYGGQKMRLTRRIAWADRGRFPCSRTNPAGRLSGAARTRGPIRRRKAISFRTRSPEPVGREDPRIGTGEHGQVTAFITRGSVFGSLRAAVADSMASASWDARRRSYPSSGRSYLKNKPPGYGPGRLERDLKFLRTYRLLLSARPMPANPSNGKRFPGPGRQGKRQPQESWRRRASILTMPPDDSGTRLGGRTARFRAAARDPSRLARRTSACRFLPPSASEPIWAIRAPTTRPTPPPSAGRSELAHVVDTAATLPLPAQRTLHGAA